MLSFLLNIPYTLLGLILGLFSFPQGVKYKALERAIILNVKSFWWAFAYMKNARAMTIGNIILLSPKVENHDLEHELIHIQQYGRMPLLFPFFYYFDLFQKGYINNKYEIEAYTKSGSVYKEH